MNSSKNDIDMVEKAEIITTEKAAEATETEHNLSVKETFRIYPMAAVWSVLFCCCIIMVCGRLGNNPEC